MKRVERIPGALLGAVILAGLLMTTGLVDPPGSLDKSYPPWMDNVWAAWLTASASTVLGGMLWQKRVVDRGSLLVPTAAYTTEMTGLILLGFTFLVHVAGVARVDDAQIVNFLSLLEIGAAVGCFLQAWDNVKFIFKRAERPGARGAP